VDPIGLHFSTIPIKIIKKEAVMAKLKAFPGIFLDEMRKFTNDLPCLLVFWTR
jgi:hypothetical protein